MQIDPTEEWQRLTAAYREKDDGELIELARDFADLTPTAQQTLRAEMQTRRLGDPQAPNPAPKKATTADDDTDPDATDDESDTASRQTEYTWKTVLCECETLEQANLLSDTLQQAGIDNWIEEQSSGRYAMGHAYSRILVAADQLEQAQAIAARPIPKEMIEEEKEDAQDYIEPKCPKCGAADPTLESAEPTNHWHCDDCGADWSDPADPAATGSAAAAQSPA